MKPGERILVAMSGGVDSSVTAALLRERGYDAVGVFMRNGVRHAPGEEGKPNKQGCCSVADAMDAGAVARTLGVPFYALDFSEAFSGVIDYFVDEYLAGRTPNPCVVCNTDLKFGELLRYADDVGATAVATGHYARCEEREGRFRLYRGRDLSKDQSYYLFGLKQEQLARCRFPLGEMTKSEVRDHARRFGLRTAEKPESQEICFVPGNDYRRIIEARVPGALREGPIINQDGGRLGTHRGAPAYTIGQRKGLGIGGGTPLYVTALNTATNVVTVGSQADLARREFTIRKPNFIAMDPPAAGRSFRAGVQIRYRHQPAAAALTMLVDGSLAVELDRPEYAVTPGQAAVWYGLGKPVDEVGRSAVQTDECLGGGWIG